MDVHVRPQGAGVVDRSDAVEKMKRGPVGLLTVLSSGPPATGKCLVQWFLYCVVMSIFAAYLSGRTLAPGTAFLQVFRVVGIIALCSQRPGIDLEWPKPDGHVQASFR